MTAIKICGLTRVQDVQLCADLKVTWVGFVFYPPSPRAISAHHASRLHHAIPPSHEGGPQRVGLFVNPHMDEIEAVLAHVPLDVLQLYTTPDHARLIRKKVQRPVWLARGIKASHDLPSTHEALDGFVIEAPAGKNDTRPGGLGKRFDWTLTRHWHAPCPWLLAGGLTPHNVQHAQAQSGARAVDVSSGVESTPGCKSAERLKEFVKNSRLGGCLSREE